MNQSYPTGASPEPQYHNGSSTTAPREVTQTAKSATQEVAQTAKEHAREVRDEVAAQTRNVAGDIKHRLKGEAQSQNERLSSSLRQLADELGNMGSHGDGDGSVAHTLVRQLSQGSRQAADYLERNGPDGVLREVQEFARRKPGTFLLGAAAAGFLAGRLGKGVMGRPSNGTTSMSNDPTQRLTPVPPTTQPQSSYASSRPMTGTTSGQPYSGTQTGSQYGTQTGSQYGTQTGSQYGTQSGSPYANGGTQDLTGSDPLRDGARR